MNKTNSNILGHKMKRWNNHFDYWCHKTTDKSFDLTEKTPSDWVLSIGSFWVRLSWSGPTDNGKWKFTCPVIATCIVQNGKPIQVEWLPTDCVILEDAQNYVEQKLIQSLTIMRDEIDSCIEELTSRDYTRIVDGKEVTVSQTFSL